jgi:hypothetical protein
MNERNKERNKETKKETKKERKKERKTDNKEESLPPFSQFSPEFFKIYDPYLVGRAIFILLILV